MPTFLLGTGDGEGACGTAGEPVAWYQQAAFWLKGFSSLRVCSRSPPMKRKC